MSIAPPTATYNMASTKSTNTAYPTVTSAMARARNRSSFTNIKRRRRAMAGFDDSCAVVKGPTPCCRRCVVLKGLSGRVVGKKARFDRARPRILRYIQAGNGSAFTRSAKEGQHFENCRTSLSKQVIEIASTSTSST